MKPQTDTATEIPDEPMLRARVNKSLKKRLSGYARKMERSEGYIIRTAVKQLLDREEEKHEQVA